MKCLNRNVLIALAAIAVVLLLLKPSLMVAALPLLLLAACPLSMIFMMRNMSGGSGASKSAHVDESAGASATTKEELSREIRSLQQELRELRANQVHRTASGTAISNN